MMHTLMYDTVAYVSYCSLCMYHTVPVVPVQYVSYISHIPYGTSYSHVGVSPVGTGERFGNATIVYNTLQIRDCNISNGHLRLTVYPLSVPDTDFY